MCSDQRYTKSFLVCGYRSILVIFSINRDNLKTLSRHSYCTHDDVIKRKHFPRFWPFERGILRWPVVFPSQRPVTRSFDVFFDVRMNKRLSKQSRCWWFENDAHCDLNEMSCRQVWARGLSVAFEQRWKLPLITWAQNTATALGYPNLFYHMFNALQWRHNEHDSVSNHQPHECLLNRLFGRISKKTSKLHFTGLCAGIHRWPVNSLHKWPVTRKMFPFDDVIMGQRLITATLKTHIGKAVVSFYFPHQCAETSHFIRGIVTVAV